MTQAERIGLLGRLGEYLLQPDAELEAAIALSRATNPWFTEDNQHFALQGIAHHYLDLGKLRAWAQRYGATPERPRTTVGLTLAGNIPLVGFHDVLCTFVAGHRALVKLSEKDKYLLPLFVRKMAEWSPASAEYFQFVDRLQGFDAVIATGSDNSARYFEAYFGKYPHIIRRNRNGVAVLDGQEAFADFFALGEDIFRYFGLGCRNVAKLYVPVGFDFDPLLEALHEYRDVVLNTKYKNNFDYNYTLLILNRIPYKANGCILLTENESLHSRIAELYYEYYENEADLKSKLLAKAEGIQCVVGKLELAGFDCVPFGKAQQPALGDYADGVDTMAFLTAPVLVGA
jgi:hypothetical protein